jgi:hypothetical protein
MLRTEGDCISDDLFFLLATPEIYSAPASPPPQLQMSGAATAVQWSSWAGAARALGPNKCQCNRQCRSFSASAFALPCTGVAPPLWGSKTQRTLRSIAIKKLLPLAIGYNDRFLAIQHLLYFACNRCNVCFRLGQSQIYRLQWQQRGAQRLNQLHGPSQETTVQYYISVCCALQILKWPLLYVHIAK